MGKYAIGFMKNYGIELVVDLRLYDCLSPFLKRASMSVYLGMNGGYLSLTRRACCSPALRNRAIGCSINSPVIGTLYDEITGGGAILKIKGFCMTDKLFWNNG